MSLRLFSIAFRSLLPVLLALLGGSSGLLAVTYGESGSLNIYPSETQNGTVAVRAFEEAGRRSKEIYYRSKVPSTTPKDEAGIYPYETRFYAYGPDGRESWIGIYNAGGLLQGSMEFAYSRDGDQQVCRSRNTNGVVTTETRREKGRNLCSLHYDDSGQQVIAIQGKIPADVGFHPGWGPAVEGLALGAGFNRSKGKLEEIRLSVSVLNTSETPLEIVQTLPRQEILVELRDASGKGVPQDIPALRDRDKRLQAMNPGTAETLQPIPPGESLLCSGPLPLKEWYAPLSSGRYTLIVKRRAAGKTFVLVSQPIPLDIEASPVP